MSYRTDSYGNAYFPMGVYVNDIPVSAGPVSQVMIPGPNGRLMQASIGSIVADSPVHSVFGRVGDIVAQTGDYTTSLVTEGSNLYFTDARARGSISLTNVGTNTAASYNPTTGVLNIPTYSFTPLSRTITINGVTHDLSSDRSWTITPEAAVTSFNARYGHVVLTSTDVTDALGFTPIASYTETDPTVPGHVKVISTTDISHWNYAYGWGNHAVAGYEVVSNKGVAGGYASLDGSGRIPAGQLPSYVDDILEYANFASLPTPGESGKIYITIDNNKTYRWSGSSYVEITASPGSTDSIAEGTTNLYFTTARARASISVSGSLSYNSTTGVISYTQPSNVSAFTNDSGYITGITSAMVTGALGYTPYNSTNPAGYITSAALSGYATQSWVTSQGYLTSLGFSYGTGVTANYVVQRDANGYMYANHINFSTSETENPSINSFFVSNGDGWSRKASVAHVKSQLGLGLNAYTSTSFLPTAGGTLTGKVSGPSTGTDVYGGLFEIRENGYVTTSQSDWGYSPAISFHWGGRAVKRFGLRYDGYLCVDAVPFVYEGGTWAINITGNAGSASSVAWTNVSGRPTTVSSFTNDSGYLTSSTGWVNNGSWYADFASYGFSRIFGNETSGGGFAVMTNPTSGGQTSLLIDGSYFSGEANGFYSLNASNQYASRVGFYNDGTINFRTGNAVMSTSNIRVYPRAESWAEGIAFIMPDASTWGGLRWQRQRSGSDGNWYVGYTALDATDDLVFGANNGGTQMDGVLRLTKAGVVTNNGYQILNAGNYTSYALPKGQALFTWNVDDTSAPITFTRSGGGDDYIIGHSTSRGFFSRAGFGWHTTSSGSFHVFSSGWVSLFGVRGGDGYTTIGGPLQANGNIYWGTNGIWLDSWFNQSVRTDASPSFSNVYAGSDVRGNDVYTTGGWFRNHTNSTGIYWSVSGWYIYPKDGSDMYLRSGNSDASIHFLKSGGVVGNYIHNSAGNDIGFLSTARGWIFRVDNSGNAVAIGDLTAYSDARLKENITPINNALQKILQLQGVSYNRIDTEDKSPKIGFIAQDVKKVVPEVVHVAEDTLAGLKDRHSIDYGKLTALLTEAIKEQQSQIEDLKKQIDYLVENR